jgi:hypothetical protein
VNPASNNGYTLRSGILRHHNRILVGADPQLQTQIISAFHDSHVGGHFGFPVTYRPLTSMFTWLGMKSVVREFVRCSHTCQKAKPERVLPPGLLQPLPIPSSPWEMATMDFIDGLPTSR